MGWRGGEFKWDRVQGARRYEIQGDQEVVKYAILPFPFFVDSFLIYRFVGYLTQVPNRKPQTAYWMLWKSACNTLPILFDIAPALQRLLTYLPKVGI
jgi:hypothetical protein